MPKLGLVVRATDARPPSHCTHAHGGDCMHPGESPGPAYRQWSALLRLEPAGQIRAIMAMIAEIGLGVRFDVNSLSTQYQYGRKTSQMTTARCVLIAGAQRTAVEDTRGPVWAVTRL